MLLKQDTILTSLECPLRSNHNNQILLTAFQKSLDWLRMRFDRQSINEAINKISISRTKIHHDLVWIYILEGSLTYHQIPYTQFQFITPTKQSQNTVKFQPASIYAYLSQQSFEQIQKAFQQRQYHRFSKFIRKTIFHSQYLEQIQMRDFIKCIQVQKLSFNSLLEWSHADIDPKISIIFKGVLSVQYKSKRNIELAYLTKGMFVYNQITDECQKPHKYKFKYISKSDQTTLLIFNSNILKEKAYCEKSVVLQKIKEQYKQYSQLLQLRLKFDRQIGLYRNKKSIKKSIKDASKEKAPLETIRLEKTNIVSPQLYSTLSLHSSKQLTEREIVRSARKHLSSSFIEVIQSKKKVDQYDNGFSIGLQQTHSNRLLVHNSWLESRNTKLKSMKTFSTLHKINIHKNQREKRQKVNVQIKQKQKKTQFFIPEQFVKKRLRIQYENVIKKIKNSDLSLKQQKQRNTKDRMKMLQQEVQSNRIVNFSSNKQNIYKICRNKFKADSVYQKSF